MKKSVIFFGLLLGIALLVVPVVFANVRIHQVLYDPVQESGSEAVELYNEGGEALDISGWQIDTDQFHPDATLPNGSRVEAHDFFVIADKNWSNQKDSKAWPDADYEETITLKNGVGGVALKNAQGDIVDSLGWADMTGFVQESPALAVKEGQSLMRRNTTGNNSMDFIPVSPVFAGAHNAIVLLEIMLPAVNILDAFLLSDDDARPGTQLLPDSGITKEVVVRAIAQQANPVLNFLNKSTAMSFVGNNTWEGKLQLSYTTTPGNYTAIIRAGGLTQNIPFEVLANKAWQVEPRKTVRAAVQGQTITQEFNVRNLGNVVVDLRVADVLLQGSNTSVTGVIDASLLHILPDQQALVHARIAIPSDAIGAFVGALVVREVRS